MHAVIMKAHRQVAWRGCNKCNVKKCIDRPHPCSASTQYHISGSPTVPTTAGCVQVLETVLSHVAAFRLTKNWRTPSGGAPATASCTACAAEAAVLCSRMLCMGPCQYSAALRHSLQSTDNLRMLAIFQAECIGSSQKPPKKPALLKPPRFAAELPALGHAVTLHHCTPPCRAQTS